MVNKRIFVVVLNWNRAGDTIECLHSLSQLVLDSIDLTVVVVDNASLDDSVERIKETKLPFGFVLLENSENLGFAAGNNVGIDYALHQGADYVMVLNNDTIVDKRLLVELVSSFEEMGGDVGVVSPKIYFAKGFEFHKDRYLKEDLGKVVWYAGGKVDWKNVLGFNEGVDEVDVGQFSKVKDIDFATGCCSLFSASALKKVGFYDKRYFMYFEDVDLSVRLKKTGYKVLFNPKGIVFHKVAQSSGIGSDLNDYFITRNRLLFGMKYAPVRSKIALIKESFRFLVNGRKWQKVGVIDFYRGNFGRGSWK